MIVMYYNHERLYVYIAVHILEIGIAAPMKSYRANVLKT